MNPTISREEAYYYLQLNNFVEKEIESVYFLPNNLLEDEIESVYYLPSNLFEEKKKPIIRSKLSPKAKEFIPNKLYS